MGGEITTAQILEPEEAAPFARIGLRISLRGDTATVRDFLYAVETREPMLIVRRMELGGSNVAGGDLAGKSRHFRPRSRSMVTPPGRSCV